MASVLNNPFRQPGLEIPSHDPKRDTDPADANGSYLSDSEVPDGLQTLDSAWWLRHRGLKLADGAAQDATAIDSEAQLIKKTLAALQDMSKKSRSSWRRGQNAASKFDKRRKESGPGDAPAPDGAPPPKVIRIPPSPPPLPPCLQCVLAGVSCSLTLTPYAKLYANDRADPERRLTPAARSWYDPLTSYALLVQELNELCGVWQSFISSLSRQRQMLEQRFMKQAVVRSAADSPFLLEPPAQCHRCLRDGERGCLQQTADLTEERAARTRPGGVPALADRIEVAWFASSGPPPLSLLPQHAARILDQIRLGHEEAAKSSFRRCHERNPRLGGLPLEAVFCRDPGVLSASQVLFRAQALLKRIADKKKAAAAKTHRYSSSLVQGSAKYLDDLKQPAAEAAPGKDKQEEGKKKEEAEKQKEAEKEKENEKEATETPPATSPKEGTAETAEKQGKEKGPEQAPQQPQQPKIDLVRQHVRPATPVEVSRMLPRWSRLNVYARRGVATARAACSDGVVLADKHRFNEAARKAAVKRRVPRETLPFWNPDTMMAQPPDDRAHVRDLEGMEELGLDMLFDSEPGSRAPALPKDADADMLSYWRTYFLDISEDRAAVRYDKTKDDGDEEQVSAHNAQAVRDAMKPQGVTKTRQPKRAGKRP